MSWAVSTGQYLAGRKRNEKDWVEEVCSKSTLKQCKLAENGAGVEKYKVCKVRML